MKSVTLQKIEEYKRTQLGNLLFHCTDAERIKFKAMHGDYKTMDAENLDHAIFQCDNTLKKKGAGLYNYEEVEKKTFTIEEIQEALISIPLHSVSKPNSMDTVDDFSTVVLAFEKNVFLEKLYEKIREKELGINSNKESD